MSIIEITRNRKYNLTGVEIVREERRLAARRKHKYFKSTVHDFKTGAENPWRKTKSGATVMASEVPYKVKRWTTASKGLTLHDATLQHEIEQLVYEHTGKKVHFDLTLLDL